MPQIRAKCSIFSVILACALVSGCVSRPVYEDSWAQQVKVEAGGCPVIDGEYRNAGEEFAKAGHDKLIATRRGLAQVLIGRDDEEPGYRDIYRVDPDDSEQRDIYRKVRLQLAGNSLLVEAFRADGNVEAYYLNTQPDCRDSTVLLNGSWGNESREGITVVTRRTLALGRAEDGSLLLRRTHTDVGFFFIWPMAVTSRAGWIRFPPVKQAPGQLSAVTP